MPIHRERDERGPYFQWGHATKYYYIPGDKRSRERAYGRAVRQAQAIYAHGYRGK